MNRKTAMTIYSLKRKDQLSYRFLRFVGRKKAKNDINKAIFGRNIVSEELQKIQNRITDIFYLWERYHINLGKFYKIGSQNAYKNDMAFRMVFDSYFFEPKVITVEIIRKKRIVLANLENYLIEKGIKI